MGHVEVLFEALSRVDNGEEATRGEKTGIDIGLGEVNDRLDAGNLKDALSGVIVLEEVERIVVADVRPVVGGVTVGKVGRKRRVGGERLSFLPFALVLASSTRLLLRVLSHPFLSILLQRQPSQPPLPRDSEAVPPRRRHLVRLPIPLVPEPLHSS
jgi:hypothetical protein